MQIIVTEEFIKRYSKLARTIQKKAEKKESLFKKNPYYPTLYTEKLEPKNKQVWSFRIDKSYRIIFRFIDSKTVLFLTVGHHAWIYKTYW